MRKRTLVIGVQTLEQMMKEVEEVWQRAEAGNLPEAPAEGLYFESLRLLLKTLTPTRLRLVQLLKLEGPLSVRGIAKKLGRDYSNVHADVQKLLRLGLLKKRSDSRMFVPWDTLRIDITVPLTATA